MTNAERACRREWRRGAGGPAEAAAVVMLLLLIPAVSVRAQGAQDASGLVALRSAYLAAYNHGDAAAMASLYVDSAVRMPYDAPAQHGRDAILAYYRNAFTARRFTPTLSFLVDHVLEQGDLAIERGRYREQQRLVTGAARVEAGKYVSVAVRGGDGRWRYESSIFNRDSAPPPFAVQRPTYEPADSVKRCVASARGLRIEVLLDRASLGGSELEMARMTFPPGLNATAGHRHGAVEILYVLEGTMEHVVNDTSYLLSPGMVGVVRPGDDVIHRVRGTDPVRALVIWAPAGELARIEPQFQPCPQR